MVYFFPITQYWNIVRVRSRYSNMAKQSTMEVDVFPRQIQGENFPAG